jgi:pentatricopeptide repeat protein
VLRLFKEMRASYGLAPNAFVYNAFLTHFSKRGDPDRVMQYYYLMRAAGVVPTLPNYNVVFSA